MIRLLLKKILAINPSIVYAPGLVRPVWMKTNGQA